MHNLERNACTIQPERMHNDLRSACTFPAAYAERSNLVTDIQRVEAVRNCDVADILGREIDFGIVASHDVVPAQTGQIFGDDQIDSALLDIIKKFLKSRTVEVQAGVAIIHINVDDLIAVFSAVVRHHGPLGADAGAFAALVIVLGKPAVETGAVGCVISDPSFCW